MRIVVSKLFMNNGKVLKCYMQKNQKNMTQKSEQSEKRLYWHESFQKGEFWINFCCSEATQSVWLCQQPELRQALWEGDLNNCIIRRGPEKVGSPRYHCPPGVLTCFIFIPHIEPLTSMTKRMFLGIGSMFSGAKKWTKYPLNTWETRTHLWAKLLAMFGM